MRKIKGYNDFLNEKDGFLKNALIGGAIAASSVSNHVNANTPVGNEPVVPVEVSDTSIVNKEKNKSIVSFVDTLTSENPNIVIDDEIKTDDPLTMSDNVQEISILINKISTFNSNIKVSKLPDLDLHDLDLLSEPGLPFKINYYKIQTVSADEKLIPMLNINYTKAINIKGYKVMFNFTRMGDSNYLGATINF